MLALWLEQYRDGKVSVDDDPAWRATASALVDEYDRLAAVHTFCSKHRKPKENLAILLRALRILAAGEDLAPRDLGFVRCAIEAQVAKRGRPTSAENTALRDRQRVVANAPAHSQLAGVAAERVSVLDPADGIEHPEAFFGGVSPEEAAESGVAEGSAMPPIVPRLLTRARSAPIETLLEEGIVPSASSGTGEISVKIASNSVAARPSAMHRGQTRVTSSTQ